MGVGGSAGGQVKAYIFQPESSLKWMRDVLIILIGAMFGLEYTNIRTLAKPSVA